MSGDNEGILQRGKMRAAFCLIERDGLFLSVSRDYDHSLIGIPGGGQEEGETDEQTCLRELWEETGATGRIIKKLYEGGTRTTCVTFLVELLTEPTLGLGSEGVVAWVDEATLCGKFQKAYNSEVFKAYREKSGS
jgi:8-oxo-dGTP pyrophosphatase MutT (NUDIX family)